MLYDIKDRRDINAADPIVPDDCQSLISHMEQYFLLGLLLTGSEDDAENCFILALDAWSKATGNLVDRELAHISMKRALVDSAIQICNSAFSHVPRESEADIWNERPEMAYPPWVAAILQLETFDRFVFVLSVLESYSDKDCADLLHSQPEEIAERRARALHSVAVSWRGRVLV
jgi:hypothetical protein